jgi:hypothetical protein
MQETLALKIPPPKAPEPIDSVFSNKHLLAEACYVKPG